MDLVERQEMKVVWLCGLPLQALPSVPVPYRRIGEHPGGFYGIWLKAIRQYAPHVHVEVVAESNIIRRSFVMDTPMGRVHILRNAYGLPFTARNVPFRWRVRTHYLLSRLKMAATVRQIGPDLIHAHGTEQAYSLAALDTGIPAITSIQGIISKLAAVQPHDINFTVRVGMERRAIKRGQNFIANTPFAEHFVRELNPSARIFHVENPVTPAFLDASTTPGGHRAFIFLGRAVRAKGFDVLLQALRQVPRAKLVVVGAPDTQERREINMQYGQGLDIEWRGFLKVPEIVTTMERVDALILPSLMDTSPNSIIEAHCAGLPVIGTTVGGIPDMVQPGRTGWLVPPSDSRALADAMRECMAKPERTRAMGEAARNEARERYSEKKAVKRLVEAYNEILQPPSAL